MGFGGTARCVSCCLFSVLASMVVSLCCASLTFRPGPRCGTLTYVSFVPHNSEAVQFKIDSGAMQYKIVTGLFLSSATCPLLPRPRPRPNKKASSFLPPFLQADKAALSPSPARPFPLFKSYSSPEQGVLLHQPTATGQCMYCTGERAAGMMDGGACNDVACMLHSHAIMMHERMIHGMLRACCDHYAMCITQVHHLVAST